jgi:hypothetical protein
VEGSLYKLLTTYRRFGPKRAPLRALAYVRFAKRYATEGDIPRAIYNLDVAIEALDPAPGNRFKKDNAFDVSLLIYRLKRNLQLAELSLVSLSDLD